MIVYKKTVSFSARLDALRKKGATIGFAPTMGALHDGHLDLIRAARVEGCDFVAASIFVNPTQFNDPRDLEKYPRTPEKDIEMLESVGCDALFMPDSVSEIYPKGRDLTVRLDFGALDKVMEGRFRPGHFQGMATVVRRLLEIAGPCRLMMGQKDFQQLSICRSLIERLDLPVEMKMVATRREADGLAMSSRNVRLTAEMRAAAPAIHRILQKTKNELASKSIAELQKEALFELERASLRPEYFEIVDGRTLLPIEKPADQNFIVACTAAFAGEVRLIDNLVLKS